MIRARLAEARLALMLLTRLPAGRLHDPVPGIGASAWAFPLAGLAVGGGAALALALAATVLPLPLAVLIALMVQIALTGALHEDGLADCADGIWGGQSPARRLEILRDSRIGSYGALALILSVGLRWQALLLLAETDLPLALAALVALAMLSRLAPVLLLTLLPPARADGLGHAAKAVTGRMLGAAALLALAPAAALLPLLPLLAVIVAQLALTLGLATFARRRLGGQTGDVLGAGQQLAEIAGLLVLVAGR
ncbi:adenosylcobinamide-GDP ribazoletransferase [Natronohydrobacter thiooxidans]|uniref:adenosylcobinamide-GDP ribazoletransferase n=1 Tax=Natronohydrobacter thiooxidans TaxID=87172 RepID=UPI0008FF320F|nr:adenosylcobinamide-GDP ribazoletransferase [Natronohydrobacter thiooxidans]